MSNDEYINRLKNLIKDNNEEILDEGFYEWKIYNWSDLKIFEASPTFDMGGYTWKIALLLNGYSDGYENYVSIYLGNHDVEKDDSLNVYADFVFSINNYKDYSCCKIENTTKIECFNQNNNEHHFPKFIKQKDLFVKNKKSNKSIVEDNKAIINVYLRIYKM
ncbi:hypothetical protein BCR32DRAFT_268290 [Anaeromyces robustus]|uniref:MATH domain-containing protein n=1 Tax=Anaeromyces robustus TaxID=1754192 RepID=A0A1Y1X6M3_9FUNG|nr:hypothetical protein BCR32DRAFT_268290 [Anaeromyces robustus]|eukprot:ORX81441.1 hypothetical protein BCR32DRAFT_268290 [Anaeromyces robustus]